MEYIGNDKVLKLLDKGIVWYIKKDKDGLEISIDEENWYLLSENKGKLQLNEIMYLEK